MRLIPYTENNRLQDSSGEYAMPTGFQSPALDYAEERLTLDKIIIKRPLSTFFGIHEGDAMSEVGVLDGSILVIEKGISPKDGDMIVAYIMGEFLVRFLSKKINGCTLIPANKKFEKIEVTEEMEMLTWGVVKSVVSDEEAIKRFWAYVSASAH